MINIKVSGIERTGKTTILSIIQQALKDYNIDTQVSILPFNSVTSKKILDEDHKNNLDRIDPSYFGKVLLVEDCKTTSSRTDKKQALDEAVNILRNSDPDNVNPQTAKICNQLEDLSEFIDKVRETF